MAFTSPTAGSSIAGTSNTTTYSYDFEPYLLVPIQQGKNLSVILLLSDLGGVQEAVEGGGSSRSFSGSLVAMSGLWSRSTHPKREFPWSKMA